MEVQNLKAYLANVGMSIREFSEKVDCTQKYMSQLALGRKLPGRRLAKDIYDATDGVVTLQTKAKECQKTEKQQQEQNCNR
jgi:hypothetical protein